jgi:leucyl/phenylalanyl-tRNA---protein transferase
VDELVRAFPFPDPNTAEGSGLLAYGGDLSPERLLSAYAQGIFPWYDEDPILWFSPDPRMLLRPNEIHVGRSLAKRIRKAPYRISMDTAFREVIDACRSVPRPDQGGTWINEDMVAAYCELFELGFAHSVEAWAAEPDVAGEQLVGGLYGISLGRAFFGESMFAHAPDASKIAFTAFVRQLETWSFDFIDCQVKTEHLSGFGGQECSRGAFLAVLGQALDSKTRRGRWCFD